MERWGLLLICTCFVYGVPYGDDNSLLSISLGNECGSDAPYKEEGDNQPCVASCGEGRAPDGEAVCQACADDTFADHDTHSCVESCPSSIPYRTAGPTDPPQRTHLILWCAGRDCVASCPSGQSPKGGDGIDNVQCAACADGKYADHFEQACVETCGVGFVGSAQGDCSECKGETPFTDAQNQKCVAKCAGEVHFQFSVTEDCEASNTAEGETQYLPAHCESFAADWWLP